MRRLRLGINARTLRGEHLRGWSRYTINLLEALLEYDVDLLLFSDQPLADRFLRRLPSDRYQVVVENGSRYVVWEQGRLPSLCRAHRVDVLHCPSNYGLPVVSPCPTVLTLHDAISSRYQSSTPWRRRIRPASIMWNLSAYVSRRSADRVITVSEHAKRDLITFLRLPSDRIDVIYEAADPLFGRRPTDEEVRAVTARHGITHPYLFYVGGWERRKNVHFLLGAFEKAQCTLSLVIGGGRAEEVGQMRARYPQLAGRVQFIGWVEEEDMPALYAGARAFVYPSEYEGFGLQVCEAMKVGCPVFVSDVGSLPEVLGDGGETFSLQDDRQLVHLIENVAHDDGFHADLRARSERRAEEFSWQKTGRETWQVYQRLLAGC